MKVSCLNRINCPKKGSTATINHGYAIFYGILHTGSYIMDVFHRDVRNVDLHKSVVHFHGYQFCNLDIQSMNVLSEKISFFI